LFVATLFPSTLRSMTGQPRHFCAFARTTTRADAGNEIVVEAVDVDRKARAAPADAVESGTLPPPAGGAIVIDSASTDVESTAAANGVTDTATTTAAATAVTATDASARRERNILTPSRRWAWSASPYSLSYRQ
jgi:hypothetical protein